MTKRPRTAQDAKSNNPPSDVLNAREAADLVKTTPAQLATLRYKKRGPPYIRTPGGRSIRYRRSDLDARPGRRARRDQQYGRSRAT